VSLDRLPDGRGSVLIPEAIELPTRVIRLTN
jgi:hypothetical protein